MKKGKRFLKALAGLAMILILVWLGFANWKILKAKKKVSTELQKLTQNLNKTEADKENLQSRILQSQNYDYLEKVAREELNFQKPGEKAVAFPMQEAFLESSTAQKIRNFWQQFFELRKKEKEEAQN